MTAETTSYFRPPSRSTTPTSAPTTTGRDEDNRAAVRAVASADLDLVGLALRAPHKAVDGVVRGLARHP